MSRALLALRRLVMVLGVVVSFALASCLAGCTNVRDTAVVSANAAATFGTQAQQTISELYVAEQMRALELGDRAQRDAEIARIREAYAKLWSAYRTYRASYLALAAAIYAYDEAARLEKERDPAALVRAMAALSATGQAFAVAVEQVRSGQ
jgi:hypothetical protein